MTTEARKRVLRYAIAADLVILVTGIGLLFPSISGNTLVVLYVLAVAGAAWKGGGWRGSLLAMLLSLLAAYVAFGAMDSRHAGALVVMSVAITAISFLMTPRKPREAAPVVELPKNEPPVAPLASVLTFERADREAEEREAARVESEKKLAEKKLAAEREAVRLEAERAALEAEARRVREREAARVEAERKAAAERAAAEKAAAEKAAAERAAAEKAAAERAAAEKAAAEREAARLEAERVAREAARVAEQALAREQSELAQRLGEQLARESAAKPAPKPEPKPAVQPSVPITPPATKVVLRPQPKASPAAPPAPGLIARLAGWMRPSLKKSSIVNLTSKKAANGAAAQAQAPRPPAPKSRERQPRVLLLEKRRGTAETTVPKIREKGIEVEVVERWIDAVDELFRFRPDLFLLDCDLPDFDKVYAAVAEHARNLPIILTTSGPNVALPAVRHAGTVIRPYDPDAIANLAQEAVRDPAAMLEKQNRAAVMQDRPAVIASEAKQSAARDTDRVAPLAMTAGVAMTAETGDPAPGTRDPEQSTYPVSCFNCRVAFDAVESDWCSCLTSERTLVCTNCLTCFCKAPPAYVESFWMNAPPRLLGRKLAERPEPKLIDNLPPEEVVRPLVLLVVPDPEIEVIVQRVCNNLGYGFVSAADGPEGLEVARIYRPNLILADAFRRSSTAARCVASSKRKRAPRRRGPSS
jgi:CheY-like chemotaxis protein